MAGGADSSDAQSGIDVIRESARAHEPDRYIAALLSPAPARAPLIALAAFTGEINKISRVVSDPHLAEIRLQWWRDAVLAPQAVSTGNPVADAISPVVAGREDLREVTDTWLDAVAQTFYQAEPASEAALFTEMEALEGTPFLLAARICGAPATSELNEMTKAAGRAYGLSRLGLAMAQNFARSRFPLPKLPQTGWSPRSGPEPLDQAVAKRYIGQQARAARDAVRPQFRHGSPAQRAALLPLALVEPYLRACEKQDHDLLRDIGDVAPLVRVWRIWRAHLTGRL